MQLAVNFPVQNIVIDCFWSDCSIVGQQEVLLCRSVLSLTSSLVLMESESLCRVGPSVDSHGARNEEMYEWKGHPEAVHQTLTSSAVIQILSRLETIDNVHQVYTQGLPWFESSLRTLYFGCFIERSEYLPDWQFRVCSRYMTGDLDVDGWIILGWISRRWDVGIWTRLGWPRIETGGVRLWVWWWTFGFREMRGISWLAVSQSAAQEGLCTME